ncbi:MAG: GntR family transcriptional regulator, partial [Casimicrobiaceae bacterium]
MSSSASLMDEDEHTPPAPKLGPIHVPRSSEVLASQLRVHILDGSIADGMSLPAERDLVVQTGLSRGSVREALRILHTEGLITTRPGRLGGSVARRPGDDALARYV